MDDAYIMHSVKGKLSIVLDQPSYVAGDTVRGTVLLIVYERFKANGIVVKVTGVEKVKWTETRRNAPIKEQSEHLRFKHRIHVVRTVETYEVGEWSYPFALDLPSGLPGVFSMRPHSNSVVTNLAGVIRYKLEAVVDAVGFLTYNIEVTRSLIVHEKFQGKPRSRDQSTTETVKMGLFSSGPCDVRAAIHRDVYYPGETVHIRWEITSSSSKITVLALKCRLIQVLNASLGYGSKRSFSRYLVKGVCKGLPAAKSIVHFQPLRLVSESEGIVTPTSTTGTGLQCRYVVEVQCELPGAAEIILRLPIKIIGPGVHCPGVVMTEPESEAKTLPYSSGSDPSIGRRSSSLGRRP